MSHLEDVIRERDARVGTEIPSMCGKCRGETLHIVVAKVDAKIVKAECRLCGAQHRYRAPEWVKDALRKGARKAKVEIDATPGKERPDGESGRSRKSSSSGRKRVAKSRNWRKPEVPKPTVEPDMDKPVRKYSLREAYEVAERVQHPKFGEGIVEEVIPGKMTVFFLESLERKTLAQDR